MFCTFGGTKMGKSAALWLLATSITSMCLGAVSVAICWNVGSRCTRALKSLRAALRIPPSHARLAQVEADQLALSSALQSVTKTAKRLSSRAGMETIREREKDAEPPQGTSKAELRKHYGLTGVTPAEFARRQLAMPIDKPTKE
jgi:hypothetical protein